MAVFSLFTVVNFWLFAAVLGIWFVTNVVGSSLIRLNYHVKAYCHNPSEKGNNIALTFDDGPNENTLRILEILKKHDAKAAFFCIGKNIEKHPEILRQIVSDGHLIGNHSYSHSHFFDFYGKERIVQELRETDKLILEITGKKPHFFRPPYGVTNPSIRRALDVTKHLTIGWNIRSMDGVSKNTEAIFNRIAKRLSPGSVVLLHDTRTQTARVLEQLLLTLAEKNYKVLPIDQLLERKAYEN